MQQMEVADYVNERPRREQKRSGDGYPTGNNTNYFIGYVFAAVCAIAV